MIPSKPVVTVITATYNWSSALRCAIESVLLQSFGDFEMLVVGDACTDDSGEVVASFGDPRLRWVNLEHRCGSQAGPNNHGATLARGEFIAYLGHDDIWYPTHLETVLRRARSARADVVHSVAVMYGPPGSGFRSTTGIFARGEFGDRDFGVPSAMLIRRDLLVRTGPWGDPATLAYPVDVEFQKRALARGAKFAATGELTVFKFNAAWRRNAYRERRCDEQRAMLTRIRSGVDFRAAELVEVIRAYAADKAVTIEWSGPPEAGALERSRRYKGAVAAETPLRRLEAAERFSMDDQPDGFEFHGLEHDKTIGTFRWSGPLTESLLEFPVDRAAGLRVRIRICGHFQEDPARDIWLLCDGVRLASTIEETPDGGWMLTARVPPCNAPMPLRVVFCTARTVRPFDRWMNQDRRWLGAAINWVNLEP
jgi:glycosyltransferase involved in cell wall biosynthesis